MKILVVAPFLPTPARFGGQRRIDGLVRELARRHDVSILAFNASDEWKQESVEATRAYCTEVRTVPDYEPRDPAAKRKRQLRSLVSRNSYEHSLTCRRDFQDALDDMLARTDFDVVQVEFAQMATFRFDRGHDRPLLVLDEHNIEFDILRRTAAAGGNGLVRRLYNAVNWRKLAREERSAWARFDGVALTSQRDESVLLAERPTCRTAVIPNGVDVDHFSRSVASPDPGTILFFGAINYFPNADGVTYFVDEVFPLIRRRRPDAAFRVLGPGARDEVLARRGNGVDIVGMVEDVNPHIERAGVVVVPLRIGGGTRLKIVEALAKGKAVVSTTLGAEGIDVVDGEHLLLADTPEAMAGRIEEVLSDPALALRLGNAGRRLVEDRYSWAVVTDLLEGFFDRLRAPGASPKVADSVDSARHEHGGFGGVDRAIGQFEPSDALSEAREVVRGPRHGDGKPERGSQRT